MRRSRASSKTGNPDPRRTSGRSVGMDVGGAGWVLFSASLRTSSCETVWEDEDMTGTGLSTELKGLLAVGAVLSGLTLFLNSQTGNRLDRIQGEIGAVPTKLQTDIGTVRTELYSLGQRVASIEALIGGSPAVPHRQAHPAREPSDGTAAEENHA